ncbi:MAG TPA: hypothetical protein QF478_06360 [Verrucomicrobiota bacterium]|nr:hypothetical protein [Verrucomicrobiota bacterium]
MDSRLAISEEESFSKPPVDKNKSLISNPMRGSALRFDAMQYPRDLNACWSAECTFIAVRFPGLNFPPDFSVINEGLARADDIGEFLRVPPSAVPEIAHVRVEFG